jgi:hypothetical protein
MPTIPFTLDALGGFALGLVFAVVCARDLSRGVLWYAALGCLPFFQVAQLSGSEYTTGFMQVEWLATIMIGVWLLQGPARRLPDVERTSFNTPLVWMIPVSGMSLVSGFLGLDPMVDASHVKVSVSIGQICLTAWPIGVYFVTANAVRTTESATRIVRLVVLMALPTVALPLLPPRLDPYLQWSVYFAVAASPFCFAASLYPSSLLKRAACIAVAFAPAVYGLHIGKALWYLVPVVGAGAIAALRSRRLLFTLLPLTVAAYLLVFVPLTGSWLPRSMQRIVVEEEVQQSLGGRAGREALAMDAIRIWTRYPLLGVGPGNNYPYMDHYSVIATAHGQYMNILLELGIVGLGCYLAFVVGAVRTGLDLLRSARCREHEILVLGWLGLFAGLVVVGGLTGDYSLPSIRNDGLRTLSWYYLQWVMLGLMVAVKRIEAR